MSIIILFYGLFPVFCFFFFVSFWQTLLLLLFWDFIHNAFMWSAWLPFRKKKRDSNPKWNHMIFLEYICKVALKEANKVIPAHVRMFDFNKFDGQSLLNSTRTFLYISSHFIHKLMAAYFFSGIIFYGWRIAVHVNLFTWSKWKMELADEWQYQRMFQTVEITTWNFRIVFSCETKIAPLIDHHHCEGEPLWNGRFPKEYGMQYLTPRVAFFYTHRLSLSRKSNAVGIHYWCCLWRSYHGTVSTK